MQRFRYASPVAAGCFAIGAFLLGPSEAKAACSQWDMPAQMFIQQSNNTRVGLKFSPVEAGFIGEAQYTSLNLSEDDPGLNTWQVSGVLEGAVEGSNVHFTIHWSRDLALHVDNTTGVYTGTIGPQGRLTGTSQDAVHPESTATWWGSEVLTCHVAAAPAPPARPPVALGRVKPVVPPVALGRVQVLPGAAPVSICDAARSARARNSPAAPGLERQCAAQTGQ